MGSGTLIPLRGAPLVGAAAAIVTAVSFALLAWAVSAGLTDGFDASMRGGVNALTSSWLTWLAFFFSFIGSAPVWLCVTIVTCAVFWKLTWQREAIDLAIAMTSAIVLGNVLKLSFARARPEVFFGEAPPTFSFPSGHALYAACLYGALAWLIADRISDPARRVALWAGAILLAGAIGLSRIYLGVHYPTDVIGGYLVAVFCIGLVTAFRANAER